MKKYKKYLVLTRKNDKENYKTIFQTNDLKKAYVRALRLIEKGQQSGVIPSDLLN